MPHIVWFSKELILLTPLIVGRLPHHGFLFRHVCDSTVDLENTSVCTLIKFLSCSHQYSFPFFFFVWLCLPQKLSQPIPSGLVLKRTTVALQGSFCFPGRFTPFSKPIKFSSAICACSLLHTLRSCSQKHILHFN